MSGIKVSGLTEVMAKLRNMELNINQAMEVAVKLGLRVIKDNARRILEEEQTNNWPDKDGHFHEMSEGDLWKAFRSEVLRIGKNVVGGKLNNNDVAAPYMEFGTKGHDISPVHAQALAFYIGEGAMAFSRGHTVHGIQATHFMSRALAESYEEVKAEFLKVMEVGGFSGQAGAALAFLSDLSDDDNPGFIASGE